MVLLIPFILQFLLLKSDSYVSAETAVRAHHESESLPEFLFEEIILDTFINPSSSTLLLEDPLTVGILDPYIVPERDIIFNLYTRENPHEPSRLKVGDVEGLKNSNFRPEYPTKILIHGWTDTGDSAWLHEFRNNYLHVADCNVIIVDWGAGSLKEYLISARLTKQVGQYLAQFLTFLETEGSLNFETLHLLGHSLGAHIAGITGDSLSGRISRITGMDPARPDFEAPVLRDETERLEINDAMFVDIIHTCAGTVGFINPIGHVDFYPNGGSFRQPGCPVLFTQYCSHGRSHQFIEESVINPEGFPAVECNSWRDFRSGRCDNNRLVFMGEKLSRDARGIFFLETNSETPFGKGAL